MTDKTPVEMLTEANDVARHIGELSAIQALTASDGRSANDMDSPWRIAYDGTNLESVKLWSMIMAMPEYLHAAALNSALRYAAQAYYSQYQTKNLNDLQPPF